MTTNDPFHGLPDRIISAKERRLMVPGSDPHIKALEDRGEFPHRVKVSRNRIGWRLSEVMDWIEKRSAERPETRAA